ncbi:hypothetical protein CC78DRAFT_619980 [Lojkania enalia]|uniref:Uncharacterized protein n=1 Tax=Lojkania enalia TaxID=147567 RepID=A0A9P4K3T9_9PLEO|nr:hypothetical protein CC78DRAFT_619980 [Didymosphaeria enalia]
MESAPHRSSSIPRDYARRRYTYTISEHASARLLLTLEALDYILRFTPVMRRASLDFNLVIQTVNSIQNPIGAILPPDSTTNHEGKVVPGGPRHLVLRDYLIAQLIKRPDTFPQAFLRAYLAVLAGRVYINEALFTDFTKGPDCTCSEAIRVLPEIDEMLGTGLFTFFEDAYVKVRPFRFSDLPAELRLHVHSYMGPESIRSLNRVFRSRFLSRLEI